MENTIAEHIVGTVRGRAPALTQFDLACWLWTYLARALPEALSFVLMPDHFHLMTLPGELARVRRVLTAFSRHRGIRMDVCVAQRASTRKILGRQIRYGFYNPVRAGYAADPWSWPWSTLRDLGGACFPQWTSIQSVSGHLGLDPGRALRGLTQLGAQRPRALASELPEVASTSAILDAVGAALRQPASAVPQRRDGRRLAVQLAASLPYPVRTKQLVEALGIGARAVQRLRETPHPGLQAAQISLADPRVCSPGV